MHADRASSDKLEETPLWAEIASQLEANTVAQVAQRYSVAASSIRAAMRRTGLGRAVRVVRPERDLPPPERSPEPHREPVARIARPTRPTRPKPPADPTPSAVVPSAPPTPRQTQPADPPARPPEPTRVAIPRPAPVADHAPSWAWRVVLGDGLADAFVLAPSEAGAAEVVARNGQRARSIERYAPNFGTGLAPL